MLNKKYVVILFYMTILVQFSFSSKPNINYTFSTCDSISFTANYYTLNIQFFYGYPEKNAIKLFWYAGVWFEPPYEYFKEVRLYISTSGPDSGYCEYLRSTKIGSDSLLVEGLKDDVAYYFRLGTYDSTGQLNCLSKPIMTIPGELEQIQNSIPAPQGEAPLYYSNISWSPDGKKISLLKTIDGNINLFIHSLTTMTDSQLTYFTGTDYRILSPEWSPSGHWMAYCCASSSLGFGLGYRIWVVSTDTGKARFVTSGQVDSSPSWINDSTIIFTKGTPDAPNIPEFYTVSLTDSKREKQLTSDQLIRKYSPSINLLRNLVVFYGSMVSPSSQPYLFIMTHSGNNIEPLTQNKYWSDIHPYWMADNKKILFTSNRSGHYEIWSIDFVTKEIRQITRNKKRGFGNYYGRPSPNGNQFAVLELGSIYKVAKINIVSAKPLSVNENKTNSPTSFIVYQNYPNPFNPVTTIQYEIPSQQYVQIVLYNSLGQQVLIVVNEIKESGSYSVTFNVGTLASGVYFYEMRAGSFVSVKKMLLMK